MAIHKTDAAKRVRKATTVSTLTPEPYAILAKIGMMPKKTGESIAQNKPRCQRFTVCFSCLVDTGTGDSFSDRGTGDGGVFDLGSVA